MDYEADVIVAGAGSAGMLAAIAAARNGARTLVIDRAGFLGGTSTAVLDTMYAFYAPGERQEKVVSGIPDEVVDQLIVHGSPDEVHEHLQRYVDNGVTTVALAPLPFGFDVRQAVRDLAPRR